MQTLSSLQVLSAATDNTTYYVAMQPTTAGRTNYNYAAAGLTYNPATGTITSVKAVYSTITSPAATSLTLQAAGVNAVTIDTTGNLTINNGWIIPTSNVAQNIGSTTSWWNTVYGKSVQAQYADLAEIYTADMAYEAGTVVVFGGTAEVTTTTISHDTRVAGVVSSDPAYLMNSAVEGIPIAMTGRVPCRVQGPVAKGTVLVTSTTPGVAQAIDYALYRPGAVIGKSLAEIADTSIQTIEVVVGRF
jgi:hypothetical protein